MDKASDYESGDSRFESWRGRLYFYFVFIIFFHVRWILQSDVCAFCRHVFEHQTIPSIIATKAGARLPIISVLGNCQQNGPAESNATTLRSERELSP